MDWNIIITAVVSSLISGGGIAGLAFFRENKRAKQLENETTASAQWRELYDKSEAKVDGLNLKVDALYKENGYLRDQNDSLKTENAVFKICKCEKLNCTDRQPPFGSQLTNIK